MPDNRALLPAEVKLGLKHARYTMFLALLLVSLVATLNMLSLERALPISFDLAASAFIVSCINLWRDDGFDVLRRNAARDDGGRLLLLILTGIIITAVLGSLAALLPQGARLPATDALLMAGTIIVAWLFGNLVYAFHYARMYYDASEKSPDPLMHRGGLKFPETPAPCFADFVNFSFVIGMTCQTADIEITSAWMRRSSTMHSIFSFFFNLVVLGLVVNVMASTL